MRQNETKSLKTKRNKTKPTKAKRNRLIWRKWKKKNRGLKEIQHIFTITMLDYFPHMFVFHQERTGYDHHWTRILCIYSFLFFLFFFLQINISNVSTYSGSNFQNFSSIDKKKSCPSGCLCWIFALIYVISSGVSML